MFQKKEMENDELCCIICQGQYGDDRLPRMFVNCGHSCCTSCIDQLIVSGTRKSPECRQDFTVAKAADLPVVYSLLKLARSTAAQPNAGRCKAHEALKFYYCTTSSKFCCRDCYSWITKRSPKDAVRL